MKKNKEQEYCKNILAKLSDYIEQDIDPAICDSIDKHIKDCPPCVAFINTFKKTVELLHTRGKILRNSKKALQKNT